MNAERKQPSGRGGHSGRNGQPGEARTNHGQTRTQHGSRCLPKPQQLASIYWREFAAVEELKKSVLGRAFTGEL
jgi:hypothetical protein